MFNIVRNMRREYMKPAMRVVKMRQRQSLLIGSPNGYGDKSVGSHRGDGDKVTDPNDII